MKRLALALLLAVAPAAQIVPGTNIALDPLAWGGPRVEPVSWNGQPAYIVWGSSMNMMSFVRPTASAPAVALEVHFAMAMDSRPCAVGNAYGIGCDGWGWRLGSIPSGGVAMGTSPSGNPRLRYEWCYQTEPPSYMAWSMNYCGHPEWCDSGCNNRSGGFDMPQLWAVVVTLSYL